MPLPPEDLAALSRLLDEGLDLSAQQQEAWLEALPAPHEHLAVPLRELLAAHDRTRGGVGGLLTDLPALGEAAARDHAIAHPGDHVGPYRLIREIGRGGMGAVWLAERADGAFKRQVALKLPRLTWAAGLAKRMARERDIVAMLEHPNIARLYDAGVDDQGRPYIALEVIDGVPIDQWCQGKSLTVRDKLRLVVQVASAVAYAHARLVVHRDLKPSNILVSGDGQVHLLDFGIARLLVDDALPGTTHDAARPLTLCYASPEQLKGEATTVQSDVFGLGVLAYVLLAQRRPHVPARPTPAAIEDAILSGDADAPSVHIVDRVQRRQVRGDVDAVVMKAIHVDPTMRYATADAFAADLASWLRGDVVSVRPEGAWRRCARVVRRHRVRASVAAALSTSLVVGVAASLWQSGRAAHAAQREAVVKSYLAAIFRAGATSDTEGREPHLRWLVGAGESALSPSLMGEPALRGEILAEVSRAHSDAGHLAQAARYAVMSVDAFAEARVDPIQQAAAHVLAARALMDSDRLDDAVTQSVRALALQSSGADARVEAQSVAARAWQRMGMDVQSWQALNEMAHWRAPRSNEGRVALAWSRAVRAQLLCARARSTRLSRPSTKLFGSCSCSGAQAHVLPRRFRWKQRTRSRATAL